MTEILSSAIASFRCDYRPKFIGQSSRTSCKSAPKAGLSRKVEIRYELEPETLNLSERSFDSKGKVVEGRTEDPMYRFRKVGD